jgi:DtxR family transcriptional regulator, Mn-dependent transcriptional regulator
LTASASVQEYLEALFKLTGGDEDRLVSTNELAAQMSVSAPSASEMLRRLEHLGLVTYFPYQGASLTERGADEGARIVRYHRLWERLLVDVLGMGWDEVHDEACRLEHATSHRLAERLSLFLNHPKTCPHGHAVPADGGPELSVAGEAAGQQPLPLMDAPEGFSGRVASVAEEPALLKYCASVGLVPGAQLDVVRVHPLDELIQIVVRELPFPAGSDGAGGDTRVTGGHVAGGDRTLTIGARVGKLVHVTGK